MFHSQQIALLTCLVAAVAQAGDVVDIGSRRELFVDHYLVENLDGTSLRLQQPQPGEIAVKYDRPWEGRFPFYTTILKDDDIYRMYYRGGINPYRFTLYAESPDGIQWSKPNLGLIEIDGSKDNNAILTNGQQFCPFIDHRPGVPPEQRYKANARDDRAPHDLIGFVSADAVHWKQVRDEAIVKADVRNNFDSQNCMFWSEVEGCYVLYARHSQGGRRATARATSENFLDWDKQVLMSYSDTDSTTPSQHLYTNQTHPYFRAPHIYVSLPGRFQQGRRVLTDKQAQTIDIGPAGGGIKDCSDGVLLTSRARSTRYDFVFRESFVRPGIGYNNWTSRTNYPALGVVQTGPHEMSLYVQRDYGQTSSHLQRMTLRLDGFTSLNAPYDGGEMLTKPLRFSGHRLEINYATSAAGSLRIEIQDDMGNPIPGFALDDCAEIVGDEIARIVDWTSGMDVGELAGRPVRLRFVMRDADLFSLRFRDRN